MNSFLSRAAAITVATVILLTGSPPIDVNAVRAVLATRPAFFAVLGK